MPILDDSNRAPRTFAWLRNKVIGGSTEIGQLIGRMTGGDASVELAIIAVNAMCEAAGIEIERISMPKPKPRCIKCGTNPRYKHFTRCEVCMWPIWSQASQKGWRSRRRFIAAAASATRSTATS